MLVKCPTCVPCGPAEPPRKTSQTPRTQQKKPRKPTPHQTDKLHHTEQWKPQVDQIHHVNSSSVFHFLLSSGNNGAWPQILLLLRTFLLALSPHGRSASIFVSQLPLHCSSSFSVPSLRSQLSHILVVGFFFFTMSFHYSCLPISDFFICSNSTSMLLPSFSTSSVTKLEMQCSPRGSSHTST